MEAILRIESIQEVQMRTWREPFERSRHRWQDNIKKGLSAVECI
jgi:hypothetical protein